MDVGIFFEKNEYRLKIEDGDLVADEGLETAVMMSLFTDSRVPEEDLPSGLEDRRGWWADMFSEIPTDKIGSKLWTILERGKTTDQNVVAIESEVLRSLQWMIDDGVADTVEAFAEVDEFDVLRFGANIKRPEDTEANRFGFLWDGQELRR